MEENYTLNKYEGLIYRIVMQSIINRGGRWTDSRHFLLFDLFEYGKLHPKKYKGNKATAYNFCNELINIGIVEKVNELYILIKF